MGSVSSVSGEAFAGFGIGDLHFGVGERGANRGDANLHRVIRVRHGDHRRGLSLAVTDGELAAVHALDHGAHDFDGARRSRHHAGAQAGEIELFEIRVDQFGDEHGGHAVDRGGALLVHGLQGGEGVELRRRQDQSCARDHGHHGGDHRAETVVERHGRANAILLGGTHGERDRLAVVEQVVVRQQDAFRRAGGAGRVLDVGHVVGGGGVAREIAAPRDHGVPGGLAEPDHVLQGKGFAIDRIVEDGAIVGARVALAEEQGADARLLQNVAQLV